MLRQVALARTSTAIIIGGRAQEATVNAALARLRQLLGRDIGHGVYAGTAPPQIPEPPKRRRVLSALGPSDEPAKTRQWRTNRGSDVLAHRQLVIVNSADGVLQLPADAVRLGLEPDQVDIGQLAQAAAAHATKPVRIGTTECWQCETIDFGIIDRIDRARMDRAALVIVCRDPSGDDMPLGSHPPPAHRVIEIPWLPRTKAPTKRDQAVLDAIARQAVDDWLFDHGDRWKSEWSRFPYRFDTWS